MPGGRHQQPKPRSWMSSPPWKISPPSSVFVRSADQAKRSWQPAMGCRTLVRTVRCHSKSPRGVAAQPLHLDGNSSKKVDAGRNTQRGLRKLGAKKLPISTRNSDLSDKRFPTSKLGKPVEDRELANAVFGAGLCGAAALNALALVLRKKIGLWEFRLSERSDFRTRRPG